MSAPIETAEVSCPYCGELIEIEIDCSAGDQVYYEDCRVCCAPIEFSIFIGEYGELKNIATRREN